MDRSISIDLYRLLLAFFVVFIHCSPDYTISACDPVLGFNNYFDSLYCDLNAISRIAVPSFFMLTGYFLKLPLNPSKYFHKALNLFAVGFLANLAYIALNESKASPFHLLVYTIKSLIAASPYYHLWFISFLFYFYLLLWLIGQLIKVSSCHNSALQPFILSLSIVIFLLIYISGYPDYSNYTFILSGLYVFPFFTLGLLCKSASKSLLKLTRNMRFVAPILFFNLAFSLSILLSLSTSPVENYYWLPTIYLSFSSLLFVTSLCQKIDPVLMLALETIRLRLPIFLKSPISLTSLPLFIYLTHVQIIYWIRLFL
jgi:surface polysaccharide O-acyltransferase-like enzyme